MTLAAPKLHAADDSQRLVIVGQTGSGKTVAGVYWLAWRSYDVMPWVIVNYKRDEYLEQIGAEEVDPNRRLPRHPGLYMVRPETVAGSLDNFLQQAHQVAVNGGGGTGFYIDEGYEIGQHSQALRRVQSQGRSLRIPTIILSQRPVWMSRFVFSELSCLQTFPLLAEDDRKTILKWQPQTRIGPLGRSIPVDVNYPETLGDYQSLYFAPKMKRLATLGRFPYGEEVLNIFDMRRPKRTQKVG